MFLDLPTAIFWDYENVPLRNNDWRKFLDALDNMIESMDCRFIRIYTTKERMSTDDRQILAKRGYTKFNVKYVKSREKNAVDDSLMISALDVLDNNPEYSQVVMITGDSDFKWLADQLPDYRIIVICQKSSYSKELIGVVDEAYSVSFLANNSRNWFYGT